MKIVQRLYGDGYFSVYGSEDLSGEQLVQQAIETYNKSTSPHICLLIQQEKDLFKFNN